jgi:hypothetical protein
MKLCSPTMKYLTAKPQTAIAVARRPQDASSTPEQRADWGQAGLKGSVSDQRTETRRLEDK